MSKTNYIMVSSTCNDDMYKYVSSIKTKDKVNPSQKYYKLLMEGMASADGCTVTCVSIRSVNPATSFINMIEEDNYFENGVSYKYIKIRNKRIIVYVDMVFNTYKTINKCIKSSNDRKDTIIFTDVLSICGAFSSLLICKIKKIKCCAIVTDLPNLVTAINKTAKVSLFRKFKDSFLNFLIKRFDSYCFLTESMNEINASNKPYIVIEGIATDTDGLLNNSCFNEKKSNEFVVLYAGGLYEKFGLKNLIDAIDFTKNKNIILHVYGEGTIVPYIKEKIECNHRIVYGGILPPNIIFELEKKASLLINCRPTSDLFTKYSFPSKTIEYLSSGTPVLTTKLEGIPEEYMEHLFLIEDESPKGIAKTLDNISSMQMNALQSKGNLGKKYVLENKNKEIQGEKLINFVRNLK